MMTGNANRGGQGLFSIPYKALKKAVPHSIRNHFAIRSGRKIVFPDTETVNEVYLAKVAGSAIVEQKDLLACIFNAHYGVISVDTIVPAAESRCIQSWVPYLKGRTKLFIYSYFEKNYDIRDPMLVRFSIVDSAARVCAVRNELLLPSGIIYSDDYAHSAFSADALPEEGSLLIQIFHPKVKTKGNGIRHYVMYLDPSTGETCTVHSLAAPKLIEPGQMGFRKFGVMDGAHAYAALDPAVKLFSARAVEGDSTLVEFKADRLIKGNLYFLNTNESGIPTSVWHDGPVPHFTQETKVSRLMGRCVTSFFTPDFEKHSPIALISHAQVGFKVREIALEAFNLQGESLSKKKLSIDSENHAIDLKKLFSDSLLAGPIYFVADLGRDLAEFVSPPCMIHLYYRTEHGKSGDQVHSGASYGFYNTPKAAPKSYRCRKFAPFILKPNLKFYYCISDVAGISTNKNQDIFLRLITDTGFEKRISIPVLKGGMTVVEGDRLVQEAEGQIRETAVVQFEHSHTNYFCTFFFKNTANGCLGTDHLTGG